MEQIFNSFLFMVDLLSVLLFITMVGVWIYLFIYLLKYFFNFNNSNSEK